MPFKWKEWVKLLARLRFAQEQLALFVENPDDRNPLDYAVMSIWTVAEYAVNVLLELNGMREEQHHRTDERARELRALQKLNGDYEKILGQLESYRLIAGYSSYSRKPSVHYSRQNVADCLDQITALCEEVNAALAAAGKNR